MIRAGTGLAVIAVVAVLATWVAGDAAAATDGGRIAFISERDGNPEIYTMAPGGTDVRRLTNHAGLDLEPAWSPDGRFIAFSRGDPQQRQIYVIAADGSGLRQISAGPGINGFPQWTPDGRSLVFTHTRDGNEDIHVMTLDMRAGSRLTEAPGSDSMPAISPDGRRIIFRSQRDAGDWELYVMGIDGSGQTNISRLPVLADANPDWSAQDRIAFDSNRRGSPDVWVMGPDGSNLVQLTSALFFDGDPTWAPDGMQIAFASDRDGDVEIYTMAADGSSQTNISNSPANDYGPDWGPSPAAVAPIVTLPPPTSAPLGRDAVMFPTRRLTATRSGVVGVPLACTGELPCRGRLTLTGAAGHRPRGRLGAATFRVPAGARSVVRIRLSRTARRAFARRRSLAVRARAQLESGDASSATLILRRAR